MTHLRQTLRTATDLVDAGLVPSDAEQAIARVGARYAVAITPAMAELIESKDAADPIARQFVPDVRELDVAPEERSDPIGDHVKSPVRGVVHRYPDRVLLKIVGVCPVYCRFCFRREMVGPAAEANLTADEIEAALDYIRAHSEIWEVILTGGDPFVMSARRIEDVTRALGAIAHMKIVRWHTRVPVVAPERVTADLVAALKTSAKTVYVALHANHPRELTAAAREAIGRLVDAGIPVVSQSVLLRGVNDDVATLEMLMRAFVEARVKPYYLHHGDLAPGTAHFRTTLEEGQTLMRALRQRVSGLAMPTYVLDIPGGFGKVPVGPGYLDAEAGVITDPRGNPHHTDGSCAP
ncbi:lysine-2,3-aminomutase-like protein [Hyphomicrobium sp.]|uniref:lysine-2,3-aminomutase-like protein n=1 Tax=Hyphomicrobium sp. TaxID=82 RepID=UPI002E32F674|nr:lysine-2,3-aminomutase-like protein [Hyphomicrobium sp.]HEX2841235.1 lysine-2,3-aminomutase-like protein [Hyphomicrobium sp.]